MKLNPYKGGRFIQALLVFLSGWGMVNAQSIPLAWPPSLPAAPYAVGDNAVSGAVDQPIPGFVGPAGDGVAPYFTLNTEQQVNPAFVEWASTIVNYAPAKPAAINPDYSDPTIALGPVTGNVFDVVSLGDLTALDITAGAAPGSITLGFTTPIGDGPGADFVVFGNAFKLNSRGKEMVFSKLAYVEVSSDGVNFARFPAVDSNPKPTQSSWTYMVADPTLIYNLFGKALNGYGVSWGVPFDLAQLAGHPFVQAGLVNLQNIRFVRFVAVVGNGSYSTDSLGHPIYDPWPTSGSPGPEVQAVGVLNTAVTPQPAQSSTAGAGNMNVAAVPSPTAPVHASRASAPQPNRAAQFLFSGYDYTEINSADLVLPSSGSSVALAGDGTMDGVDISALPESSALNAAAVGGGQSVPAYSKSDGEIARLDWVDHSPKGNLVSEARLIAPGAASQIAEANDRPDRAPFLPWSRSVAQIINDRPTAIAILLLATLITLAGGRFLIFRPKPPGKPRT